MKEEEILQEVLESAGDFFVSGLKFLSALSRLISVILQKSGKGSVSELASISLFKLSKEIERILKEPGIMGKKKGKAKKKGGFKKVRL